MRRAFFGFLLLLVPAAAAAQSEELSVEARARCIQSMVRIEVDTPRGTLSGSGTVVDPRGYILTNFHVVGHLSHETGSPGVHHGERFRVAIVHTERGLVNDEYLAEVVRGHLQLDLALIHIVSRIDEAPLESPVFTAMRVRRDLPTLGSRVWALGFPTGVRTINVTAGQIAGFENNTAGEASWMRTDTEFNPGNSGGALIDRECQLVGVPTAVSRAAIEPIELARPTARIPDAWLAALASGTALTSEPTEGLREIAILTDITDAEAGDASGHASEIRYYRLPAARPGVVTISPRLDAGAISSGGRIIRRGAGQVLITASDGPNTLIAVIVPRGRDGRAPTVHLRFTPMSEADALAGVASSGTSAVRGRVSRADGSSCSTYVALTAPAFDAAARFSELRSGVLPESAIRSALSALSALDGDGSFTVTAPAGSYQLLVLGPSGIEETRLVELGETPLELGDLTLATGCR